MKPFYVSEIRKIINGTLRQGSDELKVLSASYYLDTVSSPNTLLFLKKGWKMNWSIIEKYAPCVIVVDQDFKEFSSINSCTVIKVENLEEAYWKFVEYYRGLFKIPVLAVTGTNGKTTTKDMIKHILKQFRNVQGTEYSANGRVGHLTYLLRLDDSTEAAVYETAVGKQGDIIYSCRHFKPSVGIITNIGTDHLDGCGTMERYIQAKAEMLTALGDNGILILNADDENIKKIELSKFRGRIVYFGIRNFSEFQASDIEYSSGGMGFILTFHNMKYEILVPGYGEHQVYNAMAAIAAVHELGIGIREAAEGLKTFKNLPAHLELLKGINGSQILDDTWGMNPDSLRAALKTLKSMAHGRKTIALIGHQISSLGAAAQEVSYQVGDMIAEVGVDVLIMIGSMSDIITKQAASKGLSGEIYTFADTEKVSDFLKDILNENTILLAKCSMFDYPLKELVKSLKI